MLLIISSIFAVQVSSSSRRLSLSDNRTMAFALRPSAAFRLQQEMRLSWPATLPNVSTMGRAAGIWLVSPKALGARPRLAVLHLRGGCLVACRSACRLDGSR